MLKYVSAFLVVLALCSFAIAQEIPSATSDQKVRVQVVSAETSTTLGKGAPVILNAAGMAAGTYSIEGTTSTSSVLLSGILEDTLEAGATGTAFVSGVADVLFDSAGSTAGATFGTGTTEGEATSGQTGGGVVLVTRSGRGFAKCLLKGIK